MNKKHYQVIFVVTEHTTFCIN